MPYFKIVSFSKIGTAPNGTRAARFRLSTTLDVGTDKTGPRLHHRVNLHKRDVYTIMRSCTNAMYTSIPTTHTQQYMHLYGHKDCVSKTACV
jgi:hypothetical protein